MKIVRNLTENLRGNLSCERLHGGAWHAHVMPSNAEYEIHESSDWPGIKPCPQSEKTKHEKTEALRLAEKTFVETMAPITATATQLERDSFERQERQAREWLADNTASVPFIQTLAGTRGIPLSELVTRILVKADAYELALATALGEKHKAEDNA